MRQFFGLTLALGLAVGNAACGSNSTSTVSDASGTDGALAVDAAASALDSGGPADAATGCANALQLRCGDRLNGSTITQGRPNTWSGYAHTQRAESGRETVYVLQAPGACQVIATLSQLSVDLDLAVLTSCSFLSDIAVSSTPIDLQTVETVTFNVQANESYYVVVDGYAGAEGSYSLQVECNCGR